MIGFAEEIDYEPAPSVAPPPLIIDYKYKAIAGGIGEKGSIRSGTEPGSGELDKSRTKKRKTELTSRPRETDEIRLAGRQKQIDYGKNTIGYEKYLATIPKKDRKQDDPRTPDKYQICSKRSWDGQISKWRRLLHRFDPE